MQHKLETIVTIDFLEIIMLICTCLNNQYISMMF